MCRLTQYTQLCVCSDVMVLVGGCTAVTARVVVSDTPDDQITAHQQRVLLIPAEEEGVMFLLLVNNLDKNKNTCFLKNSFHA